MRKFNNPHVLTLSGVCLDGGPAPYIIMPFMAKGSLLDYLKKNRGTLVVSHVNDIDDHVRICEVHGVARHVSSYLWANLCSTI